jgi:hypothetical protein
MPSAVSATQGNPPKKAKCEPSPERWKLTFDHTQALRTLMDVISNIIGRVQIQIYNTEDFQGIHIESIDSKRVCLIVAKLNCVVEMDGDHTTGVCIDTTTMSTCLKSIGTHYSVDIESVKSDEVTMRSYEMISNNYTTMFRLPTLVHDADTVKLNDLSYEYTIEIDLLTLRGIVKNCLALKGEYVTLKVEEPSTKGRRRYTTLSIISEGNAQQEHVFHSTTECESNEDGCVIKTMNDVTDTHSQMGKLEVKYEETFSASYLNLFMKSMERQMISMRLSPQKPLILNYPLGIEKSSICFVLAPRTKEE